MSALPDEGLPFGGWQLATHEEEIRPNNWRDMTACPWPGREWGLYMYRRGRVCWALAPTSGFVVFALFRSRLYIAHERHVIRWTYRAEGPAAEAVQRVARAIEQSADLRAALLAPVALEAETQAAAPVMSEYVRNASLAELAQLVEALGVEMRRRNGLTPREPADKVIVLIDRIRQRRERLAARGGEEA